MSLAGKTIAILAENDYEDLELLYPLYRMLEEGAKVIVVGSGGNTGYNSKHGYPVKVNAQAADLNANDLDALIIPGGYAPDRMRRHQDMLALVKGVFAQGKVVATICHAPWVAISAGIVRGKRMTSTSAIKDDVINAGATWVDEAAVIDGNLISSRSPADLPAFCVAIIAALAK